MAASASLFDLPWPELSNVSRGATRGNQGAKGSLGPSDTHGRALLQLRVQPNVLAVTLNPHSTTAYRSLDAEVHRALKQTKTYWRKARRRQDYDPRADQAHMELHEWLQQLKDKCMAHLELLLQKGDIPGPPYLMPDNLEFAFMRGFLDRQRRGIPHNPRLRNLPPPSASTDIDDLDDPDADPVPAADGTEDTKLAALTSPVSPPTGTGASPVKSPLLTLSYKDAAAAGYPDLPRRIEVAQTSLRQARARLKQARLATREALARLSECTDHEHVLEAEIARSEERLDELISALVLTASASNNPTMDEQQLPMVASMAAVDPSSTGAGPSTTSGGLDAPYDVVTLRALPSHYTSSHPHRQSYPGPGPQTQAGYSWYPQRPVSATSVLDLGEGGSGSGTGFEGLGGEEEDWGRGGDKLDETLLHSRVASPLRTGSTSATKHAREWGDTSTGTASSSHSHSHSHPHPHPHAHVHTHTGDPPPPRKRLTVDSIASPSHSHSHSQQAQDAAQAAVAQAQTQMGLGIPSHGHAHGHAHGHNHNHGHGQQGQGQGTSGGLVAPGNAYGQGWTGFGGDS